ncbi:MAG: hypothetical protein Q8O64_05420 [Sideroxyarcus sp.]|nr:hypothetical protein [Sideroxyarcus sp.]
MNAKLMRMNHLHLIIPTLLLPVQASSAVLAGLRLPSLEKLLARSRRSVLPSTALETRLCEAFGVQSVAPLRALADGLAVDEGDWLCADPVELQIQPSQVMLQPDVACSDVEAQALCTTLNAHFIDEGLRFFAPHPQRWYVQAQSMGGVVMTPLRAAAWRDVKALLPQGADARRWLGLSNEMQMLLHQHPVNAARQQDGKPVINSLWLWGGGRAVAAHPVFDAVGNNDALVTALARASEVAVLDDLPGLLASRHERGLWVNAGLQEAWQRSDLYAYRARLEQLENEIAAPVWQALSTGGLHRLTLEVLADEAVRGFELTPAGCWKLWRRRQPLTAYIQ